MRLFIVAFLFALPVCAQSSTATENWIDQLNLSGSLPEKLLATRTAVFYDYRLTPKDLTEAQSYFQRTGIDAVSYFELDMLMAGKDITRAFADFLAKREIENIIFMEVRDNGYRVTITNFNGKETIVDQKQNAWSLSNAVFLEIVKAIYRTAANSLKRTNLLVNDFPEMDGKIEPILGRRNEFFGIDLKVDMLAVPKTGDEKTDQMVAEIFKNNYPLKYKITEPGVTEKELRKQGHLWIMCVIKSRAVTAKELLGYDMTKLASAIVSVTYAEGVSQLKNIPSNTTVYKVYFKHIDSGNVFLGTKWDADYTLEQALLNQIKGLKMELKIN